MPSFKFFVFCEEKSFLSSIVKVPCDCEDVDTIVSAVAIKCELQPASFYIEYFDDDLADWVRLVNEDEFSELNAMVLARAQAGQKAEAASRKKP